MDTKHKRRTHMGEATDKNAITSNTAPHH
ncbi:hypothetical protein APL35_gp204 [Apis mellifera filamentous virus]|nr:hypothetical protein APL35_gp204 [Apis mellifera filamentous virus]